MKIPASDPNAAASQAKRECRARLRAARAQLSDEERNAAALAVRHHLLRSSVPARARRIAVYRAAGSELNLDPLSAALLRGGCDLTVPVVRGSRMRFARWPADQRWRTGAWGILEPLTPRYVKIGFGDVVLMPLLAYTEDGQRLGQGGGFYDRAFAGRGARPLLIGVGYRQQLCAALPLECHDVRLHGMLSPQGLTLY